MLNIKYSIDNLIKFIGDSIANFQFYLYNLSTVEQGAIASIIY